MRMIGPIRKSHTSMTQQMLGVVSGLGTCALAFQPGPAAQPVQEALSMLGTGGHGHTYPGATVPLPQLVDGPVLDASAVLRAILSKMIPPIPAPPG